LPTIKPGWPRSTASDRDDAEDDAALHKERTAIITAMSQDMGLKGNSRILGSDEASKAAARVKSALRTVRGKLRGEGGLPKLVHHLEGAITEVGDDFIYRPSDPRPDWKVAF
jgi:hypothetical protein